MRGAGSAPTSAVMDFSCRLLEGLEDDRVEMQLCQEGFQRNAFLESSSGAVTRAGNIFFHLIGYCFAKNMLRMSAELHKTTASKFGETV